jgi:peptidoglycan/xylan/chitin deacetylase (PgdA/CDA1 family)
VRNTHRACIIAALLLASAALAACLAGCGASARTSSRPMVLPTMSGLQVITTPRPAWRLVNKSLLAAGHGWGQVSRGGTSRRLIALTFDAGADANDAAGILDTLSRNGLHCTFFLTGDFVKAYPGLAGRIASEGHELGNHSFSHPRFTELSAGEVESQIARTEEAVKKLTGLSTRPYFRFPYGLGSSGLVKEINALGYIGVLWTFDSLDSMGASAAAIRERISKYACPGAIVLMHCGSVEEAKALPDVIADLQAAQYRIVTLTEVLANP